VRRDTGKKHDVKELQVGTQVTSLLPLIQQELYKQAQKHFTDHLVHVKDLKDIKTHVRQGKVVYGFWCGSEKCYGTVEKQDEGLDPFGTDVHNTKTGSCLVCHKKTKEMLYVSNTY